MSITLYHNPRCSKSRQTLQLLQERGVEPDQVLYLDSPPSVTELRELLRKLGMAPRQLLRKGEEAYKTLSLADESLSDSALLKAMSENPKLIERPIVVKDDKAVLGRPPENALELLA
ncbi:MAG TPA: arsenate reductase (glutaredoxin) [Spongiibacteraceae bacterium]|nr:arsenate reductase (glutaredoxin) [Spongiibacteraceae bacterium]HCS28196.1 arsenate reductase (glutaredoxin) [Spongiibacteraceae bacterium]